MKKLMVLAAAMMVAAATQAAAVYWTANNVYAGNATDKNSGIAYFMVSDVAYTTLTAGGLDVAGVTSAIGSAYSWTPTTAGSYSKSSGAAVSNSELGLTDGSDYTAYLVIFNGSTIASSTAYLVSPTKSFTAYTGTSVANAGIFSMSAASKEAGNWTEIAPEPTSGLMMLLGMGVLALRRRRA